MSDSDSAADRDWPVGEWQNLVRRARLSRTEHTVAMTLSTYADFATGRHARPGIAVLAIDCKLSYNVVADALATLRSLGLAEISRRGRGWGSADEYRLAIPEDLLDRIDVWSPSKVRTEAEKMRRQRRGAEARSRQKRAEQQPAAKVVAPVDNPGQQPAGRVVPPEVTGPETTHEAGCIPEKQPSARVANNPRRDPPPPSNHTPLTTHSLVQGDGNHQTAGATALDIRDSRVVEESQPARLALPTRCPHGFPARYRPDGTSTCPACRRGLPAEPAGGPDPPSARPSLRIVRPA